MRIPTLPIMSLVVLVAGSALAQPRTGPHIHRAAGHAASSAYELVVEAGAALPYGELGDDFEDTRKGLGARTGYDLGARLRYFATGFLSVGPSFHYARFGDWEGVFDDEYGVDAYSTSASVLRYGLDVQLFLAPRDAHLRPYITAGGAACHNRYRDWVEGGGTFRTSSTNLALGLGAGLVFGPMELSAIWNHNPAENRNLPRAEGVTDTSYDWSFLVVRVGFAFSRF
jgi:opacity protein-like surface antigen